MPDKYRDHQRVVLFVDDDPELLKLGRVILERFNYTFVGASNGRDGLRLARELRPDLILLDYMMPLMSGKEVFLEIKLDGDESLRRTPIIMLTAKSGNGSEQRELLGLGLAAYLCKPFGHHELLNVIDNVLVMSEIKERNRALEAEVQQSFIATVRSLISLLTVKDNYTGEHSNATADYAEAIAVRFGLSAKEVMNVKLGALLHDIGKIGVPEYILCKPGRLTPEETVEMRRHVDHGAHVLEGVPHMEAVRQIVKHHHEWWNGTGYPSNLKGHEIPLGARIVAVADAYDAMTSDRPYRARLSQETALERLHLASRDQFDLEVVKKFEEHLNASEVERPRVLHFHFLEELQSVA
jgi:putative nucleotidyltransferase with HDIG domain